MLAREVSFRHRPEEQAETWDAGTTLKLGGGGRRLPGTKVTPTQNKNSRIWSTIFWGDSSSDAKANENINERHRQSKVGGEAPKLPSWGGELPPLAPGSLVPGRDVPRHVLSRRFLWRAGGGGPGAKHRKTKIAPTIRPANVCS